MACYTSKNRPREYIKGLKVQGVKDSSEMLKNYKELENKHLNL
jgi:hypothetical protein